MMAILYMHLIFDISLSKVSAHLDWLISNIYAEISFKQFWSVWIKIKIVHKYLFLIQNNQKKKVNGYKL